MLGQGGLAEADLGGENADGNFAFDEAAEDHETLGVCHGGKKAGGCNGLFGQCLGFHHINFRFPGLGGKATVCNPSNWL
ncbi:hypothetical protein D3C72_2180930 [compost metagenome]